MTDIQETEDCKHCQGLGTKPTDIVDEDDFEAVLAELKSEINGEGPYSVRSELPSRRLRAASRIIWLANRIVWLDHLPYLRDEEEQRRADRVAIAQDVIDAKVEAGVLVRLPNGRIVASSEYDAAVHGPKDCGHTEICDHLTEN
ncbi:hypothetical protein [Actinoplanes subtropicus]|uniref:hypothetical protein n=1 Tax=Actinoplanes subtropicus TaxID=543632 RepID=UPI0004C40802|nr:hypothetical protein [Actinoplanes subtropicus]